MATYPLMQAEWWWKWGRPAELWMTQIDLVSRFVEAQGLRSIPLEELGYPEQLATGGGTAFEGDARLNLHVLWPYPFPGGLRFPHLHLGGDVYRLDREQWADFSKQVLSSFQRRLGDAGSVSFDQLLEVSNALSGIG